MDDKEKLKNLLIHASAATLRDIMREYASRNNATKAVYAEAEKVFALMKDTNIKSVTITTDEIKIKYLPTEE